MSEADSATAVLKLPFAQADDRSTEARPAARGTAVSASNDLLPRLELRVGITGHRPPRLAERHHSSIERDVTAIFAILREALISVHQGHPDCFASSAPGIALVSPLAAGGDSLASEVALKTGETLYACLPFGVQTYREDFEGEAREQFNSLLAAARRTLILPGDDDAREDAYRSVGLLTASQCDILLAIWDGEPARGTGGTPEIVSDAVASGLPVVVIDARSRTPPRLLWNVDDDGSQDIWTTETVTSSAAAAELPRLVRQLVAPPDRSEDLLRDLAFAANRDWRPSIGFPALQVMTGARRVRQAFSRSTLKESCAQLTPLQATLGSSPQSDPTERDTDSMDATRKLGNRFAAADVCANRFALRYRGGFIGNFALAALAVDLALLGLLLPVFKMWFVIAELLTIISIVVRTRQANRLGWHRRWLDARHLAELLRLLPLAAALGDLSLLRHGSGKALGSHGWLARATAREIGMIGGPIDAPRVTAVRDQALLLIGDQIRYHQANAKRMNLMDHRLRLTGELLFIATIVACILWLAAKAAGAEHMYVIGIDLTSLVTFISALLPAVGAALYGIRTQGDFCALAARSDLIADQLGKLDGAIRRDPLDYRRLTERLRRLSAIMLAEVDQWRQSSERRPVQLPG